MPLDPMIKNNPTDCYDAFRELSFFNGREAYCLSVIIQQYINSGVETPYKELQC